MSYETGTAFHIDDMLGKLSVFAQANGWTENKIVAGSGNGASSELYLSKGSSFWAFEAQLLGGNNTYHGVNQTLDHPFLDVYGSTGFDGGQVPAGQPNAHKDEVETNWLLPNFTAYHFFTDPTKTYLHVVIEVIANEFRHFHVGLLDKIGVYDGGEYTMGLRHSQSVNDIDDPVDFQHGIPWTFSGNTAGARQFVRANVDGFDWKISQGTSAETVRLPLRHAGQGEPLDNFVDMRATARNATPNTFNSTVVLFPIPVHIVRSTTQFAPIGKPFDIRVCNIKNVAPSTSIFFGSDEWLIFPFVQKQNPANRNDTPNTGWLAFAYLKIP